MLESHDRPIRKPDTREVVAGYPIVLKDIGSGVAGKNGDGDRRHRRAPLLARRTTQALLAGLKPATAGFDDVAVRQADTPPRPRSMAREIARFGPMRYRKAPNRPLGGL